MLFTSPWFLLLLLALPIMVWLGWPSRGPSRKREILSLGIRLLIALLLIAGLAGLEIQHAADRLAVVFLVDSSDSMSVPVMVEGVTFTPRQMALAYVRDALTHLGPDDQAAVILFGADALVERPLSSVKELESFTSKVIPLQTDLAGAIRLGLALLPADAARRMVILSDGLQTTGDALEAAQLAQKSGTQILVAPFGVEGGAEALLSAVSAPAHLRQGEQFGLEVSVESAADQTVGVRVLAGDAVAYEGNLTLHRGQNNFTLPLAAGAPGFAVYRVLLTPRNGADTFHQNNELATFSQIAGPPKVLLIKNPQPRDGVDETKELVAALAAANLQTEVQNPAGLPGEMTALAEYASVILVDVPARELSSRQQTALQTYVRDLGGGLVVVGGPSAYGVGGYFRTPLEETLPVEMQIKDQKRRARVTIVFVIDHSGSMSETSGGVQKVELAKEAVIRSIELLAPTDKVGVVAFDDTASWVAPIASLEDPAKLINAVGTIRADGGTDIFGGVHAASLVLPNDDSAVKHIILLTDGGADPAGIAEMVRKIYNDYGITLSTVGVGRDAAPFLPSLAEVGGGLYHFAADPSAIPSIFAEETALATRAYIIEAEFFPKQVSPSPILSGITSAPALLGYIGTTAKSTAQTILISDQEDPVLAAWQYGLGKSVAWTSDATGRWAKNWVSWDQFVRFWAQVVRYTINENAATNVSAQVVYGDQPGGQAMVVVDAQSDTGAYLNGLTVQANVVGPDGSTQVVTLQQTAPGRYTGVFNPTAQGAYLLRVTGASSDTSAPVAQTAGWVLSYSPEYRTLTADANLLLQVAGITGGGSVGKGRADIFKHDLKAPARATQPIWPWLLMLAALLLPVDIAVRRLVVTRYELRRAWQHVSVWFALRPVPAREHPRAEQLSSLRKAKDRASVVSAKAAPDRAEIDIKVPSPIVTTAKVEKTPAAPPPAVAPPPPPASSPSTSTSAALLAAKKRVRDRQ